MKTTQSNRVMGSAVLATVSTAFPGFLIGALSVQVAAEFDVSEARYGWGLGSFFLAAMLGSIGFGRLAQIIGPRRQVSIALLMAGAIELAIAAFADSFAWVIAGLAAIGLLNAAIQTGVNLMLAQAKLPRLGFAVALKQSGMPSASLLAGFAVPVIALTVGWRWAYVVGAALTFIAAAVLRRAVAPIGRVAQAERAEPTSTRSALGIAAVSGLFMAFAAGALVSWLVGSGVDQGLDEGAAGLVLSLGAAIGITIRMTIGSRLDTYEGKPFRAAALVSFVGAAGMAALAFDGRVTHVAATVVAFGAGWVWPVFTNFGIVRRNAAAAGAATGITQMGVYVGVFLAPLISGWVIETWGYPQMWLMVAVSMVVGSSLALLVADHF
ncbi:MAG: MFS transporter [Acidimicrobiales bacterium]